MANIIEACCGKPASGAILQLEYSGFTMVIIILESRPVDNTYGDNTYNCVVVNTRIDHREGWDRLLGPSVDKWEECVGSIATISATWDYWDKVIMLSS